MNNDIEHTARTYIVLGIAVYAVLHDRNLAVSPCANRPADHKFRQQCNIFPCDPAYHLLARHLAPALALRIWVLEDFQVRI